MIPDTTTSIHGNAISGFADFNLPEHILFNKWKRLVADAFRLYGFVPLESRRVERATDLTKKGGMERELYCISHWKGGAVVESDASSQEATLCLPFDRTLPFALFVANNIKNLHFPLRRQDIDYSWRVETPKTGRYRAFIQADVDIVDRQLNILAEAECIKAAIQALSRLKIPAYTMYLNHIEIAKSFIANLGIKEASRPQALRVIDKLDKITKEQAVKELSELAPEIDQSQIAAFIEIFKFKGKVSDFQIKFEKNPNLTPEIKTLLEQVVALATLLAEDVDPEILKFCPGMVRGLDYYTGIVLETFLNKAPEGAGSITSGGRYDNLVEAVADHVNDENKIQGFGVSIGLNRLFDICIKEGFIKPQECTTAKVIVCYRQVKDQKSAISPLQLAASNLAGRIRKLGIDTNLYTNPEATIKKQLQYANSQKFSNAIMVMDKSTFVVKNMCNSEQREVQDAAQAIEILSANIWIQEAVDQVVVQEAIKFLERYPISENPSGKKVRAPAKEDKN